MSRIGFGIDIAAVGFDKEPNYGAVQKGVFRSTEATGLQVLDLSRELPKFSKKVLVALPKGMAIIGGFARGLYTGEFSKVGDIDVFLPTPPNPEEFREVYFRVIQFLRGLAYQDVEALPCKVGYFVEAPELNGRTGAVVRWNPRPILPVKSFWKRFRKKTSIDVALVEPRYSFEETLGLVDVSVAQIGYLNGRLYATEIALKDLEQNQFRITRPTQPKRVIKYQNKGFCYVDTGIPLVEDSNFPHY